MDGCMGMTVIAIVGVMLIILLLGTLDNVIEEYAKKDMVDTDNNTDE